ncbi:MAG: carboxypeptidase regulatory-like domain-containing protein [Saprospiraceae bacterium]|nr:carboxypeptidase regulatory-like domain-containing protein [Saprospiraceae bacterium]
MSTIFRAGWLAFALVCAANVILAQASISEDLQRANKQFDLQAYNLALKTYKQVLDKDANNGQALARIAECYVQLNQPEASLDWYRRAVEQREPNSDVQLRYGRALMMRGDYDNAKRQFLEYAALNDNANEVGRHFANMCDFAIRTAKKTPDYIARNEAINTSSSDFGPSFYNNRVVYSSSRTDIVRKTQSKPSSDWTGGSANQLFVTQRNPENGSLQKPDFFRNDLQNSYNESPVSFSTDGKKVAFCRNTFVNGARQLAEKGSNMSLYIADVVNGEWVNVKPFPYNGTDFSTGFPCLIGTGNSLLFASNNPATTTGGKGWDIYLSQFVNGEWSTPRNLGAPVNTPGNEVTPYYDGTDLYFSSDWHNGLGGLDVFRAEVAKESVKNVYHLGPGINSSYDDYGFIYNSQNKVGYLTSTRPGGRGNEDIWQITYNGSGIAAASTNTPASANSLSDVLSGRASRTTAPTPQTYNALSGQPDASATSIQSYYLLVTDAFGKPLPGVDVDMLECGGDKGQTDSEGKFYFSPSAQAPNCFFDLSKNGYEGSRVEVREYGKHNLTVSLSNDKRQEFSGVVLDARTRQPLSSVTVDFVDKGKTIRTQTDQNGGYTLDLVPGVTYNIEYSRYGYKSAKMQMRPTVSPLGNRLTEVTLATETSGATAANSTVTPPPTSASTPTQFTNPAAQSTPTQFSNPAAGNQPAPTPVQHSTTTSRTTNPAAAPTSQPAPTTLLTAKQGQPETPSQTQQEFNGYSVQLSATPANTTETDSRKYETLSKHGNVYTKLEDGKNKVRLGIFPTKEEAQKVLKDVNNNPQFKGAFIVAERGADKSLILGKQQSTTASPVQYSTPTASAARGITPANTTSAAAAKASVCYAIQLEPAASGKSIAVKNYSSVTDLGNVYGKMDNGVVRMRLGVWSDYDDAEEALDKVKQKGFKDALIVTEKSTDESIQEYHIKKAAPGATTNVAPVQHTTASKPKANDGSKYYVRLCALSDPSKFDAKKLEGSGVNGSVEKWPVGNSGLTAIVLAGYSNLEAAERDKDKVRTNGFPEAYVVRELNGTVTRIK